MTNRTTPVIGSRIVNAVTARPPLSSSIRISSVPRADGSSHGHLRHPPLDYTLYVAFLPSRTRITGGRSPHASSQSAVIRSGRFGHVLTMPGPASVVVAG